MGLHLGLYSYNDGVVRVSVITLKAVLLVSIES